MASRWTALKNRPNAQFELRDQFNRGMSSNSDRESSVDRSSSWLQFEMNTGYFRDDERLNCSIFMPPGRQISRPLGPCVGWGKDQLGGVYSSWPRSRWAPYSNYFSLAGVQQLIKEAPGVTLRRRILDDRFGILDGSRSSQGLSPPERKVELELERTSQKPTTQLTIPKLFEGIRVAPRAGHSRRVGGRQNREALKILDRDDSEI
ncbi:hypothetical protein FB451DRAFT_1178305 [Mycena latifolia]|nr:hypothetical protein FB451DRAFT_1178305 [Mycena latifolia]